MPTHGHMKWSWDGVWQKDIIDYAKLIANICYTPPIELTFVNEALQDDLWINAMHDELLQFLKNNI